MRSPDHQPSVIVRQQQKTGHRHDQKIVDHAGGIDAVVGSFNCV